MHVIALTGCDGSGKSTIVSRLSEQYPVKYVKEPSNPSIIEQIKSSDNIFKIIRLFVKDREQLYEQLNREQHSIIISDRSFICSMVYQSLQFDSLPIESLNYIYKCNQMMPIPDQVIYVYAQPSCIVERLNHRKDNDTLTQQQVKAIQDRYQLVFQLLNIKPITIDTTHTTISDNVSKILSALPRIDP